MNAEKHPNIHALPAAVYRLFNEHDVLLYVGASYDPDARIACHKRKPWGPEIARTTIAWYHSRPTAFRIENDAIKTEGPLYNKPRGHRGSQMVPIIVAKPRDSGAWIEDDLVAEFMRRTGKTETQVRKLLAKGFEKLRRQRAITGDLPLPDAA